MCPSLSTTRCEWECEWTFTEIDLGRHDHLGPLPPQLLDDPTHLQFGVTLGVSLGVVEEVDTRLPGLKSRPEFRSGDKAGLASGLENT